MICPECGSVMTFQDNDGTVDTYQCMNCGELDYCPNFQYIEQSEDK